MKKTTLLAAGLALLSATGCHSIGDEVQPRSYDALALEAGHWEWESTSYYIARYTPATEGYTRQLVFEANGQLLLRRANQPDYVTTYQLSVGGSSSACVSSGTPLLTFSTNEGKLANNERKLYSISEQNGQQTLRLVGEKACFDGGGYETYHWVAEKR